MNWQKLGSWWQKIAAPDFSDGGTAGGNCRLSLLIPMTACWNCQSEEKTKSSYFACHAISNQFQ